MAKELSDIGLIGLAVMGQNLALNIADHGFKISVYNRTTEKTDKFVAENPNTPGGVVGSKTLEEFVQSIAKPRKIIILVQAGKGTDAVIDSLIQTISLLMEAMLFGLTQFVARRIYVIKDYALSEVAFLVVKKVRVSVLHSCQAANLMHGKN